MVRGPERETTVWRKGKIAGIWVNAESVTFTNVPSFYAVASSRPIEEAVAPATAALYRIGVGNLKFAPRPPAGAERVPTVHRRADRGAAAGRAVYGCAPARSPFSASACSAPLSPFPPTCRPGPTSSKSSWCATSDVVGGQTTPLVVSKVGLDAAVFDFASRRRAAYGAIAVLTAVVAGWLASLPFRGV